MFQGALSKMKEFEHIPIYKLEIITIELVNEVSNKKARMIVSSIFDLCYFNSGSN